MDINDLRALSTLFLFIAFVSLCIWAYSSKRKKTFDEAANLPFADEEPDKQAQQSEQEEKQQ